MPSHDFEKASAGQFRRPNGKFVKKKTVAKEVKCIEACRKQKKVRERQKK